MVSKYLTKRMFLKLSDNRSTIKKFYKPKQLNFNSVGI